MFDKLIDDIKAFFRENKHWRPVQDVMVRGNGCCGLTAAFVWNGGDDPYPTEEIVDHAAKHYGLRTPEIYYFMSGGDYKKCKEESYSEITKSLPAFIAGKQAFETSLEIQKGA